jgi:hypothetical protein
MKQVTAFYLDELPVRALAVLLALWLALSLAHSLWVQPRLTQEEKPSPSPAKTLSTKPAPSFEHE